MSITNLKFKSFLTEAMSSASADKAAFIIAKYLKRKTGVVLFKSIGTEVFHNASGKGFGMRFYSSKKNISLRFNWANSSLVGLVNLASIDFWNGKNDNPFHIEFDTTVSIIKTLPIIADIMNAGGHPMGPIRTLPDGVPLDESSSATPEEMLEKILDIIAEPSFSKGKVYSLFKGSGLKIFDALEMMYPEFIVKVGTSYAWQGKPRDLQRIIKNQKTILDSIGAVSGTVSKGSAKEKYEPNGNAEELEKNIDKLSFEAQLKDLEHLVKLTVSGASNALFVAGRGGVGKTYTVEKILEELGMRDGQGYFKNTGSASAAGLYSLLFRFKNDIVFFDDSDDALGDTEARNLLKAATDTKKIRKLVWNKMGKNIADPEEMTDAEILDAGMIPRYFEFTGKIIFISNLNLDRLDPDKALRTRAFIIDIDPTDAEIYDFMDKIVGDIVLEDGLKLDMKQRRHVVDLLRKGKSKQSANLRKLSRGLSIAGGALAAGVDISDDDLSKLIERYA